MFLFYYVTHFRPISLGSVGDFCLGTFLSKPMILNFMQLFPVYLRLCNFVTFYLCEVVCVL